MRSIMEDSAFSGSFKKLIEEIIGDGNKNRQQVLELLTHRVFINFILFCATKNAASRSGFTRPLPVPKKSETKQPIILKIKSPLPNNKQNQCCLLTKPPQTHCNGKRKRKAENGDWVLDKPKKTKLDAPTLPNPPPDLPLYFKNRINAMNGTQLVLIIQKPLTDTDVNIHNSRLSIPLSQIKPQDFLTEDEIRDFDKHNKIMEQVPFIDPSGEVNTMTLTQWDMPKPSGTKSSSYILRTNWNKVLKANLKTTSELNAKRVIQIWSFQRQVGDEQQLSLALVVLNTEGEGSSSS